MGELTTFLARLTEGMGRPERRAAMTQYVAGLLLDGKRKSIEPIAGRGGAHEVLSPVVTRDNTAAHAGAPRQAALADRAR